MIKNWKYEVQIDALRIAQAVAELGLYVFLALWEVGAMWTHIAALPSATGFTKFLMYAGSLGTQFGMLVLLLGSCFVFSTGIRIYCGVAAMICTALILYHTGGIIAYDAAKAEGRQAVDSVAAQIRKNNEQAAEQIKGTIGEAGNAGGKFRSQNIREATEGAQAKAAELAANANQSLTSLAAKSEELARAKTYFSEEYMNGWMYVVLFGAVAFCVGMGMLFLEGARHLADKNGNGHPDWAEPGNEKYDPSRAQRYWADYNQQAQIAAQQYKKAQEAKQALEMMQYRMRAETQSALEEAPSPKQLHH